MMTAHEILSARLSRAKEQATAVVSAVAPFTNSKTHKIVADKNADCTIHYRRIFFDPKPDFLRIGILFGEFTHQIRATLDNLAHQLVLASGNQPTTMTEFPVFLAAAKFRKDRDRKTRGMKPAIITELERLQPFNTGGNAPQATALWLIHDLNIVDKHKIIIPLVLGHEEGVTRFPKDCRLIEAKTLEDGAPLLTIYSPVPRDEVQVDADMTFSIGIQHGLLRFRVEDLIPKMLEEVGTITRHLGQFLK
jgi:hypothetical protein